MALQEFLGITAAGLILFGPMAYLVWWAARQPVDKTPLVLSQLTMAAPKTRGKHLSWTMAVVAVLAFALVAGFRVWMLGSLLYASPMVVGLVFFMMRKRR